jgi:hypothetical protein
MIDLNGSSDLQNDSLTQKAPFYARPSLLGPPHTRHPTPSSSFVFHFLSPPYELKTDVKGLLGRRGSQLTFHSAFRRPTWVLSERLILVSQSIGPKTPSRSTNCSSSMTPTTQWPSSDRFCIITAKATLTSSFNTRFVLSTLSKRIR